MTSSNRSNRLKRAVFIGLALLTSACASAPPPASLSAPECPQPVVAAAPTAEPTPPPPAESLDDRYRKSIFDAAVFDPKHVLDLVQITTPTVSAVTWTRPGIYKKGAASIPKDIWVFVTVAPEVKDRCASFTGDKNLRLQQLLGLPPDPQRVREFVTMTIQVKDLFRPCADPDPSKKTCPAQFSDDMLCLTKGTCGKLDKKESARRAIHVEWLARWSFDSWKTEKGYPFSRLGYTYDWAADSRPDHYGASEFVLRPESKVQVTDVAPTETFCGASGKIAL